MGIYDYIPRDYSLSSSRFGPTGVPKQVDASLKEMLDFLNQAPGLANMIGTRAGTDVADQVGGQYQSARPQIANNLRSRGLLRSGATPSFESMLTGELSQGMGGAESTRQTTTQQALNKMVGTGSDAIQQLAKGTESGIYENLSAKLALKNAKDQANLQEVSGWSGMGGSLLNLLHASMGGAQNQGGGYGGNMSTSSTLGDMYYNFMNPQPTSNWYSSSDPLSFSSFSGV